MVDLKGFGVTLKALTLSIQAVLLELRDQVSYRSTYGTLKRKGIYRDIAYYLSVDVAIPGCTH